jgi:hypothetical protein
VEGQAWQGQAVLTQSRKGLIRAVDGAGSTGPGPAHCVVTSAARYMSLETIAPSGGNPPIKPSARQQSRPDTAVQHAKEQRSYTTRWDTMPARARSTLPAVVRCRSESAFLAGFLKKLARTTPAEALLRCNLLKSLASPARFELTTPGLGILCSILLSYGDFSSNSTCCRQFLNSLPGLCSWRGITGASPKLG